MPYSTAHKANTRRRIIEAARAVFNRRGMASATIDDVMQEANLTRGGFYNHFSSKEDLLLEVISSYPECVPSDRWPDVRLDGDASASSYASQMIDAYLSTSHLYDLDVQCPLVALASDVRQSDERINKAYEELLREMAHRFERGLMDNSRTRAGPEAHRKATALMALLVGGLSVARTMENKVLSEEIIGACREMAQQIFGHPDNDRVQPSSSSRKVHS